MDDFVPEQIDYKQQYLKMKKNITLHKKWSFPLKISSVNVTSRLLKKSLMENFIFCAVLWTPAVVPLDTRNL